MTFQISEIIDSQPGHILAKVSHEGTSVVVILRANHIYDWVVGKSFQAEISFDEVIEWNVIDDFSYDRSSIWQEPDGIHLAGWIHNVLDYGDGKAVVDVYIQTGPEFFSVTSEDMDEIEFDTNSGLEIVVKSLYLQPIP